MNQADRRTAIASMLAAAFAPSLITGQAIAQSLPGSLIAPPVGPMLYRRVVQRDLVDGRQVRVLREFSVSFRRFSDGFMVHGEQLQVDVEAPPALSQIIALEQQRDETRMFPLALDPFGRLLSAHADGPPQAEVTRAFEHALGAIAQIPAAARGSDDKALLLAALHRASEGMTAHLPVDIFAPSERERREEQSIALPNGEEGRVETEFRGQRDAATGLMLAAERAVITSIASSRRSTREAWSLRAI